MKNQVNKSLYQVKRIVDNYGNEKVGVLIGGPDRYYTLDISGKKEYCWVDDIKEIKSVRLSKEERNSFNTMIKEIKSIDTKRKKLIEQIEELEKEAREYENELNKTLERRYYNYINAFDLIDEDMAIEEFNKTIKKFRKIYNNTSTHDLYIHSYKASNGFKINVNIHNHKYAQEGDYGLLYSEYDGSMHMWDDEEQCKKIAKKYFKEVLNKDLDKLLKTKTKMPIEKEFSIDLNDKNTFEVNLELYIKLDRPDISREELDIVKEDLKTIFI